MEGITDDTDELPFAFIGRVRSSVAPARVPRWLADIFWGNQR